MSERATVSGRLDQDDYGRLVREAGTERQEIVIRLSGEVGLRPAEISRLTPGDVEAREHDGVTHFFLRVDEGETERLAYLPADLEEALRAYASSNGCADAERIVGVSARRLQMVVSDATDHAADALDVPALRSVSTRELRRYHARSLLDRGINPRIVSEITAWSRLETLADSLEHPDLEAIVVALGESERREGAASQGAGGPASTRRNVDGRRVDLVDTVVRLGATLSSTSTREAIEREACDALGSYYRYAWIASETGSDSLEIRERSTGETAGELGELDAPPGTVCRDVFESGRSAIETGTSLPLDGDEEPTTRVVVPVQHADTAYGVLEVGVGFDPEEVDDVESRMLVDLGRRLGQAIAAVERRRLLLADTVVRLSFRCIDRRAIFVRLSDAFDCSFTLTGLVPGEDGSLLAFVWLEGASPDVVFQRATETEAVDSARLIRSGEDGSLLEFVLTADSPALTLVERGGSLTELTASAGRSNLTAEFVPDVPVREVVKSVEQAFPDSEMVAKREVERSVQTGTEFRQALDDTLTDKQRSALRAAYLSGYFDWPRGSTAEELAESLGVSSPTFHSHLRRAQRKLLATFLEGGGS